MFFQQIITPGLGCFSYLIGCQAAGVAAVVDPRRDVEVYLNLARKNGMKIVRVFETHVHADHISGARELAEATGASVHLHQDAPVAYETAGVGHGNVFELGQARLTVLHTPGHTPESISLVVADLARSPEPQMVLTGDLLFVGDTGRPDLPGEDILEEQVRNLYDSLHSVLGSLPDGLEVYPAHGRGSLCGGGLSAKPHTTLGYERVANNRLRLDNFTDFRRDVLANLPMRPQSFSRIIAANRSGPPLAPNKSEADQPGLTPAQAAELMAEGAMVLDLRPTPAFAASHIPGSLHVDSSQDQALNWIGAVVPTGRRLILVLEPHDSLRDHLTELRRIGLDQVLGQLKGGVSDWIAQGRPVAEFSIISAETFRERLDDPEPPLVLDVRTRAEFERGGLPEAVHLPFETLLAPNYKPAHNPDADVVIVCRSGFRAAIAASLLPRGHRRRVSILAGGLAALGMA